MKGKPNKDVCWVTQQMEGMHRGYSFLKNSPKIHMQMTQYCFQIATDFLNCRKNNKPKHFFKFENIIVAHWQYTFFMHTVNHQLITQKKFTGT